MVLSMFQKVACDFIRTSMSGYLMLLLCTGRYRCVALNLPSIAGTCGDKTAVLASLGLACDGNFLTSLKNQYWQAVTSVSRSPKIREQDNYVTESYIFCGGITCGRSDPLNLPSTIYTYSAKNGCMFLLDWKIRNPPSL